MGIDNDTKGIRISTDRQTIKFSVIIPAYNAEKAISRCLQSVTASSYEAIEVIVVNDGSTDRTAEMVEEFIKSDKRIMLFSQPNAGPSTARNNGMKYVSGDVITFVDSDDYIEPDYFDELSSAFTESNADVVYFEFNRVDETGRIISRHNLPQEFQSTKYYDNLMHLSQADMFGYTWIKAFKCTVLERKRFDTNMCLFEDEVFTCMVLRKPVKIKFLYKPLYNYVCTGTSSLARRTHINYHIMCDKVYLAWEFLLRECDDDYEAFLREKATHMQRVCKFYGLERNVHTIRFFKELSNCSFVNDHPTKDGLIHAIKNKQWIIVYKEVAIYKMKSFISKLLKK